MRRLLSLAVLITLALGASAALAQGCPNAAKEADQACIWDHQGVNWSSQETATGFTVQVKVPGCPHRSRAVREKIAAQIPACQAGKAPCRTGDCPFSVPGLTFVIENAADALTIQVTPPDAAAKAEFKKRMDAKLAPPPAPAGGDVFRPEGGCGCGGK